MSMYELFKTDENLESGGVIIDYGDFRITIARAGGSNKTFAKVLEATTKPYRRAMQTETLDNDVANSLLHQVYAASIILNWEVKKDGKWQKGIEAPEGGKPLPFTKENVIKTFESLHDLFLEIQEQSNKIAIFREDILEADSGN